MWLYQFAFESRLRRVLEWRPVRIGLVLLMLAYLMVTISPEGMPFIYMQF